MSDITYNFEYPSKEVSWMTRDVLLFNLSVGTMADELHFLYELHPEFQALPTFPTILAYKGTTQEIVDFRTLGKPSDITGLSNIPKFDRNRIVDGQKRINIIRPLPVSSKGRNFELRQKLLGLYDKGNAGTVIETEMILLDKDSEELYVSIVGSVFAIGQGNWGGPKGPQVVNFSVPRDREPDFTSTQNTSNETPLLYRLNGDYNPLHAEPGPGKKMGFGGAILHGLFTWNAAAHALLRMVGGSKSSNMREFEARFVAPVTPGQTLHTQIWGMRNTDKDGFEEFRFRVINSEGKIVLGNGRAFVKAVLSKGKI